MALRNTRVLKHTTSAQFLMASICKDLNIAGIMNHSLGWEETGSTKLSPGLAMSAMIVNTLCQRRALWKVEEFYNQSLPDALFGPNVKASDFNDDALGRFLDRFHEASPGRIFTEIALNALSLEKIGLRTVHCDTTSNLTTRRI